MTAQYTNILKVNNNTAIDIKSIPVFSYSDFSDIVVTLLQENDNHCVAYFAHPSNSDLNFIIAIANDAENKINLLSYHHKLNDTNELNSLTPLVNSLSIFEREISENFGIIFNGHPWLKPVRYPYNRFNKQAQMKDYPFYSIKSNELHEVGVGPIHAGIIEPGHFRFICNGENVLHLEIQLGWQHRGIENLIIQKKNLLQRILLSETIAGDTVAGHSLAFVQLIESLGNIEISEELSLQRSLALELERIAVYIGDISALCTDVAYNVGSNIFGILRTGIINFTQSWCGNRLGKGMNRVGGSNFPFSLQHKERLIKTLDDFESKFIDLSHITYRLTSIEKRFDEIGKVTEDQIRKIGGVGMVARSTNIKRDIRWSHPFASYSKYPIEPIVLQKGDVFARFLLRRKEIKSSVRWIKNVLSDNDFTSTIPKPLDNLNLKPNSFAISLTEGWRGEICHCAITNHIGELEFYKIKDPSFHNWKALELSLRDLEISDFPINNKSYNLSYCGFDL